MTSRHWVRIALGCVAVFGVAVFSRGENPLKPLVPLPEALPIGPAEPAKAMVPIATAEQDSQSGCIVLRDGTVRFGKVVELAAGYQIATRQGTFVLNYDQVRAVAKSLPLAYEQIRNSYERPTANDHLDLGRWCAKNGLMEEALTEAENALILEPTRKEAVELLKLAEVALNKSNPGHENAESSRSNPVPVTVISSEAQGEFIRRIQPLAVNKCGNGNCHGSGSANDFKLAAVRTGSSPQKIRSEQNLQAILKYLDAASPAQSRLLVVSRTADGVHDGLFVGDRGSDQYQTLLAWVEKVSREQDLVIARPRTRSVKDWREGPRLTVRPRNPETEANPPKEQNGGSAILEASAETVTSEEVAPRGSLRSETIQRLLQNHAPDEFDPEEFNRLVHGDRRPVEPSILPE